MLRFQQLHIHYLQQYYLLNQYLIYELCKHRMCHPRKLKLFDCGVLSSDVRKPFLVFEYIITSHKFNPTMYKVSYVSNNKKLHNTIMKLHNEGFGYTKIHKHLIENGYQIGENRTCVDSIIKKIKMRQEFLNQSIYKSGFQDFRVEMLEVIK